MLMTAETRGLDADGFLNRLRRPTCDARMATAYDNAEYVITAYFDRTKPCR